MAQEFAVTQISASPKTLRDLGGQRVGANSICDSERYLELDFRQSYGDCTQHDWKVFDFDGRAINAGSRQQQPFLSEQAGFFVPLKVRRPCAPMHLGKTIVETFTNLLFGESRFPKVMVLGDRATQDFDQAIIKAARLRLRFVQARNFGGSTGTAVLSWCFRNGKPCVQVHRPKNMWVHVWEDRDELVPAWVSEIYRYHRDEWHAQDNKYYRKIYWYRRDWTTNFDVVFPPIPYTTNQEPDWLQHCGDATVVEHNDGFCHVVWIQNIPHDDIDGIPDYHGQYDTLDSLDVANSVLIRGATLNLDPTLILKMDPQELKFAGVKKGSDNAIVVGLEGDAHYMELSGQSITSGIELIKHVRRGSLENAQCVVPDPNELAASGTSSVAMKVIYSPSLARGSILRDQYGEGLERLLEQMRRVAYQKMHETVIMLDDQGNQIGEADQTLELPPKVEESKEPGGQPTKTPVEPGDGGDVTLDWGEWFPMTPQDKNQMVQTISLAAGSKPVMSAQSAAEECAVVFGRDPKAEQERAAKDQQEAQEHEKAMSGMFGNPDDAGGKVTNKSALPFGAKPRKPNPFAKDSEQEDDDASEE